MKKPIIVTLIAVVVIVGGSIAWLSSDYYRTWLTEQEQKNLPPAENVNLNTNVSVSNANATANVNAEVNVNTNTSANANANTNTNTSVVVAEKNLAVPFTSQAPHAVWDQDHEEFCEEAAVLMVGRFWRDLPIPNATDAEAALQKIKAWELDNLGFYYDTTAAETARVLEGMYEVKTRLIVDPTIDDIKREVAAGRPVIVPTAGQQLGNPYFTAPGPIYHMLVIKGYTDDGKFITNDAGTKRGANYVYKQSTVMAAMHDWVPNSDVRTKPRDGTVAGGRKVVIVAERK